MPVFAHFILKIAYIYLSLRAERGNLKKRVGIQEITSGIQPFALQAKHSLFKIVPYDFMPRSLCFLGNCSCVALDNCSCIILSSPIPGLVPPASLQSSQ